MEFSRRNFEEFEVLTESEIKIMKVFHWILSKNWMSARFFEK